MMARVTSVRSISEELNRCMPPLPPTPPLGNYDKCELQSSSLPCLDEEDLYDEPDKVMQGLERSASASTLLAQPAAVSTHA